MIVEGMTIHDLAKTIRAEAEYVKSCFTEHAKQAMHLSSVAIGGMIGLMHSAPAVALAGPLITLTLAAVVRSGLYKYLTANRNFGYELFLERTGQSAQPQTPSIPGKPWPIPPGRLAQPWDSWMRFIGWEEAIRAWRVVQARVFSEIYVTPGASHSKARSAWDSLDPRLYKLKPLVHAWCWAYSGPPANPPRNPAQSQGYPWFMLEVLTRRQTSQGPSPPAYFGGTYLRTVFGILELLQYVALLPLAYVSVAHWGSALGTFSLGVFILGTVFVWLRQKRVQRRREILEEELHSIHSCGILWQAVAVAHFRAEARAGANHAHYTEYLTDEAESLAKYFKQIHEWINGWVH